MGKTTLAVDLVCNYIMRNVRRCYAVSPTFYQQDALARFRNIPGAFPRNRVWTIATDQVFERIFTIQNRDRDIPAFLFVDDSAAESSTNKGNKGAFARLCLAAPHLNLSIVGCFQRLTACSPAFRDNCEALISFIPTKIEDVGTIVSEFNAYPAHEKTKQLIRKALVYAWQNARFCFIYREKFTGKVYYFAGFNQPIRVELKNVIR